MSIPTGTDDPMQPAAGTIELIRREIERNRLRAHNGIKYLMGGRFVRTGATPKDIIWQRRKAQLWRYRSVGPRIGPPVLVYIGLVSRSYVLDLHPGNSFVERLLRAGHDVFVLDWGIPDEADAANTIATYVHEVLPRAVEALLREASARDFNLIAYCMGGCLTLAALGSGVVLPTRSLMTMATPIDFSNIGEFYQPLRSGALDTASAIDQTGNVPASVVHGVVRVRRPTGDLAQYANLLQNLANDSFLEGFQAMREWVADHVPFPGAAFREVVDHWLVGNGFVNGDLRVGGKRVDLGRIRGPVLCLIAERDEMVPLGATEPLPGLLQNAQVETLVIPAGHISLTCGRAAVKITMPAILDWLGRHSDPPARPIREEVVT